VAPVARFADYPAFARVRPRFDESALVVREKYRGGRITRVAELNEQLVVYKINGLTGFRAMRAVYSRPPQSGSAGAGRRLFSGPTGCEIVAGGDLWAALAWCGTRATRSWVSAAVSNDSSRVCGAGAVSLRDPGQRELSGHNARSADEDYASERAGRTRIDRAAPVPRGGNVCTRARQRPTVSYVISGL
jgi:hypothetical protein